MARQTPIKTPTKPSTAERKAATASAVADALRKAQKNKAAPADLLQRIVAGASELRAAMQTVETMDGKLKEAKGRVLELRTESLPGLLDEAQIPGLDLDDGYRIERGLEVHASIAQAREEAAAEWLRKNNLGSIIKDEIQIPIDKGNVKGTAQILSVLKKFGIPFVVRSSVHTQTLKALVRERLEEGKPVSKAITYTSVPVVNVKASRASKKSNRQTQEN